MKFNDGPIDGVVLRDLKTHRDQRGWLMEVFRKDEVPLEYFPAMGYVSATKPGVTRGPHEHREQADLFCFIGPSVFRVYCWDARKDSPTFGNRMVVDAGSGHPVFLIVPPGVVHAYKNVGSEEGWVMNYPNALYAGKGRTEEVDEIRHEEDAQSVYIMEDPS